MRRPEVPACSIWRDGKKHCCRMIACPFQKMYPFLCRAYTGCDDHPSYMKHESPRNRTTRNPTEIPTTMIVWLSALSPAVPGVRPRRDIVAVLSDALVGVLQISIPAPWHGSSVSVGGSEVPCSGVKVSGHVGVVRGAVGGRSCVGLGGSVPGVTAEGVSVG